MLRLVAIVVCLGWALPAAAYPQYVAKSYTNCVTCHYSPTGGGLLNSYGHATIEALLPNVIGAEWLTNFRQLAGKNDVTGYSEDEGIAFHWDVGLDARLLVLQVPTVVGGGNSLRLIPMLVEAGGVVAVGPVTAYGTITVRRPGAARSYAPFSREHWLQFRIGKSMSLRAGRLVLPFGTRIPDHTQYIREDLGFSMWDQSYALEFDAYTDDWSASAAIYFGDLLLTPFKAQERGGVFTAAYNITTRGSLGVSALMGSSNRTSRFAGALFVRLRVLQRTYVLAEASTYYRWSKKTAPSMLGFAGMLRAGWFALESLDLYAEVGGRGVLNAYNLTKLRYMFGANWNVSPWLELSPALLLEEDVETGLAASFMGQIHVIY